MKRLQSLSAEELKFIQSESTPKNTTKSIQTWINVLTEFATFKEFHLPLFPAEVNKSELCVFLCLFIASVRQQDGNYYKANSLKTGFHNICSHFTTTLQINIFILLRLVIVCYFDQFAGDNNYYLPHGS